MNVILPINWDKCSDPDVCKEVVRASELLLEAQLKLATSSDQRAAVLASIFTAAGTAVIGAIVTYSAGAESATSVILGGGAAAASFVLAAIMCVRATLPVGFYVAGIEPDHWRDDIERGDAFAVILASQIDDNQRRITENDEVLKTNARRFIRGAKIGISAPLVGFSIWLIANLPHWFFC